MTPEQDAAAASVGPHDGNSTVSSADSSAGLFSPSLLRGSGPDHPHLAYLGPSAGTRTQLRAAQIRQMIPGPAAFGAHDASLIVTTTEASASGWTGSVRPVMAPASARPAYHPPDTNRMIGPKLQRGLARAEEVQARDGGL